MDEQAKIMNKAHELANALQTSRLYTDYRRHWAAIRQQAALVEKVHAYKQSQAEYEFKRLQNQPVSFDEEKNLSHLYAELTLNQEARLFLESEDAFLSLYEALLDRLDSACEVDTDF